MTRHLSFTLNGRQQEITTDENRKALWVLRTDLALTGTKFGCGQGLCGACTILVDDHPVRACEVAVSALADHHVRTIEGLAEHGMLHPLQQAFVDHQALQCGFCTPGMVMTAYALLLKAPHPARGDIVAALDRNLCRCGSHTRILAAVEAVARPRGEPR